ncbi:MAG TPA: hypothetical protein VNU97_07470 [Rhizomicrobium sp.]|jgi:hypothetical protein|nr:hypothetical protein [Rhizomicrobium sp.]
MSGPSDKERGFSRRAVAIGGGIAAALGIGALGLTVPRLLGRHYRQSRYDDLLAQLVDREAAVRVGQAAIATIKSSARSAPPQGPDQKALAKVLRQRLERRTLAEVTDSDLAQGFLVEVQGWVMPITLVMLCMLAALES